MTSSLVKFWHKYDPLNSNIHPDDRDVLRRNSHFFNLDHPVTPYIGDIDHASVVLIFLNGGYDPKITPNEFDTLGKRRRFAEFVHNPRPIPPEHISTYYKTSQYGDMIEKGHVAMVNVVPYRSAKWPGRKQTEWGKLLKSFQATRSWFHKELVPDTETGKRMAVRKRDGDLLCWPLNEKNKNLLTCIDKNGNPYARGKSLTINVLDQIQEFIAMNPR